MIYILHNGVDGKDLCSLPLAELSDVVKIYTYGERGMPHQDRYTCTAK